MKFSRYGIGKRKKKKKKSESIVNSKSENYLLNIVYVESDTKFRSLILETYGLTAGKSEYIMGSSMFYSEVRAICRFCMTGALHELVSNFAPSEKLSFLETSFEGGLEKQFNKTCLTLIRVPMLSKLRSCCLNNNVTSRKYN